MAARRVRLIMTEPQDARYVIAADLGGTHLRVAVVDSEGNIHSRVKLKTPTDTAEAVVSALVGSARACLKATGLQGAGAISVVVPSPVNPADGSVEKAPNLPCLNGFPLRPALNRELGWPAIVENDADAAALGELWRGAARGYRTVVCITLGTGVGGAIFLDGKLWRGVSNSAGEIGHTSIDPFSSVLCTCGNHGCLEVFTAARAIVRMTREGLPGCSQSTLHLVDELTADKVFNAGLQGDELALAVFQRMGAYLGVAVANLINLLNPEMFVIGGGVAAGWELFAPAMHREIAARAFPGPAALVKIVPAACGDDAGLLGAARLAFDQLEDLGR